MDLLRSIAVTDIALTLVAFLSSLGLTWYIIPIIVKVSNMKQLFDEPNTRTSHFRLTPTLGGIAIYASIMIVSGLFLSIDDFEIYPAFVTCLTILFFIGLKDDILIIDPIKKLFSQFLVAYVTVVIADHRIVDINGVMGISQLSYLASVLLSIVSVIGIINGFNFIDGIDGLASGIGIITLTCFGGYFLLAEEYAYSTLSFIVIGALFAFFRFNVFSIKNKLFMGDTGSLILGFIAYILMVGFLNVNNDPNNNYGMASAPAIAFGILIVPVFDAVTVMFWRIFRGDSPFRADKTHLHHYLILRGLSHFQATGLILVLNLLIIVLVFLLRDLQSNTIIIILITIAGSYSIIVRITPKHYLGKSQQKHNYQPKEK